MRPPFIMARPWCKSPAHGMELSYEEIGRVIEQTGTIRPPVFRGSTTYLPGASTPVPSAAATDLVERALAHGQGGKTPYARHCRRD